MENHFLIDVKKQYADLTVMRWFLNDGAGTMYRRLVTLDDLGYRFIWNNERFRPDDGRAPVGVRCFFFAVYRNETATRIQSSNFVNRWRVLFLHSVNNQTYAVLYAVGMGAVLANVTDVDTHKRCGWSYTSNMQTEPFVGLPLLAPGSTAGRSTQRWPSVGIDEAIGRRTFGRWIT